jgi:hypothetical protein
MASELLTIVVMTRDRIDFLKLALQSVFERQKRVPPVIVSDNSTHDYPEMEGLRRQYGFTYVRQSGTLTATEHHNVCLTLPTTRWMWLLHDDDELYPDAVGKVESFLSMSPEVGILVGGLEYIHANGKPRAHWIPQPQGIHRGEEAMLAVGLDWGGFVPNQVFRVEDSRSIGFLDIEGAAADYSFAVLLAYKSGVTFLQEVIGRYREGEHQNTPRSTTQHKTEQWLHWQRRLADPIRASGCSGSTADQITDYMTWRPFYHLGLRWLESDRSFVFRVKRQCVDESPWRGQWQNHVRQHSPFLFWGPEWIAWPLFVFACKTRNLLKRITKGRSEKLIQKIKPLLRS